MIYLILFSYYYWLTEKFFQKINSFYTCFIENVYHDLIIYSQSYTINFLSTNVSFSNFKSEFFCIRQGYIIDFID